MRAPQLALVSLFLTLSAGADAQTVTPPPAPLLTVGAGMKELVFDWDPVPGASIYRLMANTAARGYFEPVGDRIPSSRSCAAVPIAVHDHDWENRRYLVLACNTAGCTRSNIVLTGEQMLDSIGYFKASNTGALDGFGSQIALSADGSTMAVAADDEDGTSNSLPESGAVYIYRRNGRRWTQEALLKASDGLPNTRLGGGSPLSFRYMGLSANGATLAVGAPTRARSGQANAGVVFVFQRAADNSWSETAQFSASPATANDFFGYSVDVSSDGRYIKVNSQYPQGGAGTPTGRTHVWHWNGSVWSHSGAIAPHYAGDRCPTVRLTPDSRLLISACHTPAGQGRIVTTQRVGANTWQRVADQTYLWFENPNMAVSYDGYWLAVHEANVYYPEGGIGIYHRAGSNWVAESHYLPPGNVGFNGFGHSLEFSRHGDFVAFGDPSWRAAGAGILPYFGNGGTESPDGAVWILKNRPGGIPAHFYTALLKAANPGNGDRFGHSLAFGGADGYYLAVGAPGEDGAATGVDGNQQSEAAEDAGAVYLQ